MNRMLHHFQPNKSHDEIIEESKTILFFISSKNDPIWSESVPNELIATYMHMISEKLETVARTCRKAGIKLFFDIVYRDVFSNLVVFLGSVGVTTLVVSFHDFASFSVFYPRDFQTAYPKLVEIEWVNAMWAQTSE